MRKTFPERHKQLWLWLEKNPKCTKGDHAMWREMQTDNIPIMHCFACEEAIFRKAQVEHEPYVSRCEYCPIHILIPGEFTACLGGLYFDYVHEENLTLRSALALKIANLPWR